MLRRKPVSRAEDPAYMNLALPEDMGLEAEPINVRREIRRLDRNAALYLGGAAIAGVAGIGDFLRDNLSGGVGLALAGTAWLAASALSVAEGIKLNRADSTSMPILANPQIPRL